jgi:hypothetical protein
MKAVPVSWLSRMPIGLILGGVALYLICLVIQTPLAWLVTRLPKEGDWQLSQASGSPLNGAVGQISWRSNNIPHELGALSWTWIPGELLNGRLGFSFVFSQEANKLKGVLLLGTSGNYLKAVQGRVDANLLSLTSRLMVPIQPQGSLALDIPELHLSSSRIHGEARVDWLGARSALVAAPLGDYSAALRAEPDGRSARITLRTLQGALAANGEATFTPGKGASGKFFLQPPHDDRSKLYSPILYLFGRPDASGTWALTVSPQ